MFHDELQSYLEKNLKIYTDPQNHDRITYLALTDSHKIFAANKAIRKHRSQSRYNKTSEGSEISEPISGIVKRVRPTTAGKVTEFTIERQNVTYDVTVDYRTDKDLDRLQVTVIN